MFWRRMILSAKENRIGSNFRFQTRLTVRFAALLTCIIAACVFANAQNTVTGAFQGKVTDSISGDPVAGAMVKITNEKTLESYDMITDRRGEFFQGLLASGVYLIQIQIATHKPQLLRRPLNISKQGEIVPVPVKLEPLPAGVVGVLPATPDEANDIRVEINTTDARRDGSFEERKIAALPLGSTTITRSPDELALLLPGVAPPPQTIGDVAGPGVGPGVGSAGQFAVNGLRSRANNFTVDGSDNNDEDIGVRRQGFLALTSQPVESIQEFQIITLLAPAQFGRNIGAQVNLVSKTGGSKVNGSVFGFLNSDKLNARNFFDIKAENRRFEVRSSGNKPVFQNGTQVFQDYSSGGKDPFTAFQGGGTVGGPIVAEKLFYFVSAEFQNIDSSVEKSFAVPTVEQRGAFGTGAKGIDRNFFNGGSFSSTPVNAYSSSIFSLFPFPNDPAGVYGANTFSRNLSADGRGVIFSGRLDQNFSFAGRGHSLTGRYNFTDDDRDIPSVNDALFSTVTAKSQTHNVSVFLNSQLSGSESNSRLSNQLRVSFGHSRLKFEEIKDTEFLIPSDSFPKVPFLLNAPYWYNATNPKSNTVVSYVDSFPLVPGIKQTVESVIGPLGQVSVAGFSPIGVDVYNFPQTRVNNTYQIADEALWRLGRHSVIFGTDIRRTDLNSDLARLSRPLVTFIGMPGIVPRGEGSCANGGFRDFCFRPVNDPLYVIRPEDLVSLGAASSFLLTFNVDRPDSKADLRYYQLNFYGQDTFRVRDDLSVSFGLRYEYNTPVKEVNGLIEKTFSDPRVNELAPGLAPFIDGRTGLYEPDRNNFSPRVGFAYSPKLFGGNRTSVFRAGYGIFYDQILGAVVNQSRNVFPTFLTLNLGGLNLTSSGPNGYGFSLSNPGFFSLGTALLSSSNGINIFNGAEIALGGETGLLRQFASLFPNAISATYSARELSTPLAHHYSFSFEQQLSRYLTASVAYVGTKGQDLLRFSTPNLGSSLILAPLNMRLDFDDVSPETTGVQYSLPRPEPSVGAVNRFETTAASNYSSLQAELRARISSNFSFLAAYVYSSAKDDASDVFDLAGAYALPQNTFTFEGERGPANFDVRHRFTYNAVYSFSRSKGRGFGSVLTNGLQIAGTGRFQTGQPFTVNSIVDVNLDGNLTDRLNTTDGIAITGDRSQPIRLTAANPFSLLAPFGRDGAIGRNTFRARNVLELDASVTKPFSLGSRSRLLFRTDFFNFINRSNFGVPVRLLEAPGFGKVTRTLTPGRRIQFSLKLEF